MCQRSSGRPHFEDRRLSVLGLVLFAGLPLLVGVVSGVVIYPADVVGGVVADGGDLAMAAAEHAYGSHQAPTPPVPAARGFDPEPWISTTTTVRVAAVRPDTPLCRCYPIPLSDRPQRV